jgi:hypothetical protein
MKMEGLAALEQESSSSLCPKQLETFSVLNSGA